MVTSRLVLRILVLRSSGHQVFSATDQLGPSSFAACGQLGITLGGSQDICEPRRFGLRSEWILGLVSPPCSEIQPYIGHQASLFTSLLLTENKKGELACGCGGGGGGVGGSRGAFHGVTSAGRVCDGSK